jgi:hypothetical protein
MAVDGPMVDQGQSSPDGVVRAPGLRRLDRVRWLRNRRRICVRINQLQMNLAGEPLPAGSHHRRPPLSLTAPLTKPRHKDASIQAQDGRTIGVEVFGPVGAIAVLVSRGAGQPTRRRGCSTTRARPASVWWVSIGPATGNRRLAPDARSPTSFRSPRRRRLSPYRPVRHRRRVDRRRLRVRDRGVGTAATDRRSGLRSDDRHVVVAGAGPRCGHRAALAR